MKLEIYRDIYMPDYDTEKSKILINYCSFYFIIS